MVFSYQHIGASITTGSHTLLCDIPKVLGSLGSSGVFYSVIPWPGEDVGYVADEGVLITFLADYKPPFVHGFLLIGDTSTS